MRKAILIAAAVFASAPLWANLYRKHNRPGVVFWHGDPTEKKVALTFDDGPNEPYTSQILDILKDNNIKATFFMLGKNVEFFPDAAKRVATEGHAIGNHSYTHPDMILETESAVGRQIDKAESAIQKATGVSPHIFRPPFGMDDPHTFRETEKIGYVVVKWSVTAKDWARPGVERIIRNVEQHIENGAIILMHDGDELKHGGNRSQTVQALPRIIADLKAQGFTFVTVPELLKLDEEIEPLVDRDATKNAPKQPPDAAPEKKP